MAEGTKLRCKKCGLIYFYVGYPAFIGCPRCKKTETEEVTVKGICSRCHGTGKTKKAIIMDIEEFNGVDTDGKQFEAQLKLHKFGKYGVTEWAGKK